MDVSKRLDLMEIVEHCATAALGNQDAIAAATERLAKTTTELKTALPEPIAEKTADKLAEKFAAPLQEVAKKITADLAQKLSEVRTQADYASQAYRNAADRALSEVGTDWKLVCVLAVVCFIVGVLVVILCGSELFKWRPTRIESQASITAVSGERPKTEGPSMKEETKEFGGPVSCFAAAQNSGCRSGHLLQHFSGLLRVWSARRQLSRSRRQLASRSQDLEPVGAPAPQQPSLGS